MKYHLRAFTASALLLPAMAQNVTTPPTNVTPPGAQGPCGNPAQSDCPICPSCSKKETSKFTSSNGSSCDGNSLYSYNGNAHRAITDLSIAGSVGGMPLEFTRFSSTRLSSRNLGHGSFGKESPWSHNFDWLMRDNGGTPTRPIITITYPEGKERSFWLKTGSTTEWVSTTPYQNPDVILATGDDFVLTTGELTKYQFKRRFHSVTGGVFYRIESITDPDANTYTLTYNNPDDTSIRQVTDAAGHFIKLHYRDEAIQAAAPTKLNTASIPFDNNANPPWREITVTPGEEFRILAFYQGNDMSWTAAPRVREIEFYDENNVKITGGTPIGSSPWLGANDPAKAIDGNITTFYQYSYRMAGYVGIDLGAGNEKKVSRIRYQFTGSSNPLMSFVGIKNDVVPTQVLSHIEGSDGRTVTYNYGVHNDPSGLFQWVTLAGATYPDAAVAAYTYKTLHDYVMPVIDTTNDVRYSGRVKRVRYHYDNNAVVGFVTDEFDDASGQLIVSVRWNGPHNPKLVYPNGKVHLFNFTGGNITRMIESFGAYTDYTYMDGFVTSETDSLNRKTTYSRRADRKLMSITTPGGSVTSYTRDTAGYLTAVTENGKTTSYILDPTTKRRTRTNHPDGTFETWTYNSYGQETSHRLRNGTTETWTYNTAGLLTDHLDETGLLTTYTYNALNRLASKSRHLSATEIHTTSYEYDDRGSITKITHPDGTMVQTQYDTYGNPVITMDERGQVTYRTYDSLNRKTSETDPMGRTTSYDYASNLGGGCGCNTGDRPVLTTYPDGTQTLNSYDKEWRLISTTTAFGSPEAATTSYTYDVAGQRTSMTDPNGSVTTYTYDLDGRVLTTTVASGTPLATTTRNTYDVSGNLLESTRAFGTPIAVTTKMTYDNMDRNVTTTQAFGTALAATSTTQYNTLGQLWKTIDPLNRTTEFLYDTVGRSWKTIAPNGFVSTTTYDAASRVTATTTLANGSSILDSSSMTYDNMDRPLTTTDNDGITTTHTYGAGGLLLATSSTNGLTASFEYDANGTRTKTISAPSTPQQQVSESIYDPVTRIATQRDTLNNTTTMQYDRLGRVISTTNPLNQTTTISYTRNTTAQTLTTVSTNHAGHTTTTVTNARGETQSTTNPNNETIIYYYNALGQNIGYLDAKGASFAFEYDALGRRSKRTEPDATYQTYTYDLVGNLITHRKADANVATYTYNINNQPLSKIWSGSSEFTTWAYDTHYRLATITNQDSVIGYTYHGLTNRLASETTSIGSETRSVTRTYDANIRLSSIATSAVAHTLSYGYHNASGQLHTINNDGPPPLATYGYTNGLVSTIALENGTTTTTLRDAASQITSSSTSTGSSVKSSVAHGYDAAGRRTYAEYEDNLGQAYSYDNAGQVKNVKVNTANPATTNATASPTHAYNYDSAGNRTSSLDNGLTTNYSSISVNAYTSISGGGFQPPSQNPTYDPNGNMLVAAPVSGAVSYSYDRENRLRTITTGIATVSHTYDALGRLIQTDTPAATDNRERYTWAGWTLLTREIFTGTTATSTHRYTWGLDLSGTPEGAGGVGGLLAIERNVTGNAAWDIRYPHYDANGNIIALSDQNGNISARYRYDAFGKTLEATDLDNSGWSSHNIHGFSTKPNIGATGLLYYGYRHYTPALGRWINRDPIEERGGVNLYGFVGNDGVGRWDLLGLHAFGLDYVTYKLENGYCGEHIWVIAFQIYPAATARGGAVLQKIKYKKFDVENCDSGEKYKKPLNFFEMFGVNIGKNLSNKDEWGFNKQKCTKGEIQIEGEAIFYDGMTYDYYPPPDFGIDRGFPGNNVGPISKDRIFFPIFGRSSNKLKRVLKINWNCCNGKSQSSLQAY